MILAAGLGTRLKPFTNHHPKALFVYEGKTLLEHALDHLKTAKVNEVIINVHHFADQILEYLHYHDNFGIDITISDESDMLLETGGGLKKASYFLAGVEPAIIRNVDIISDLNLSEMVIYHKSSESLATLAVRDRSTSRYFLFDEKMTLCGWENKKSNELTVTRRTIHYHNFAFSGIQIIEPELLNLIIEEGKFSLTNLYLRLAEDYIIKGFIEKGTVWKDIGTF